MRYFFPGIMIVAVIALLSVLSSRPPGNPNPASETPAVARSTESSPAAPQDPAPPSETAANTPAVTAPAAAAPPQPPAPSMQHGEAPMQHGGMAMHPAAALTPNGAAKEGTSTPTPAAPRQSVAPVQQAAAPSEPGGAHGDAVAGRQAFRKCQACHSLEPGKNLVGPSLAGIMGKKSGGDTNFNYSPAMKQAGITWTPQTLDQYLADPQKAVPGNRMPFPGLKSEHDRADIIAFLAGAAQGNAAAAKPAPSAAPSSASGAMPGTPQPPPGASYVSDVRYTLRTGIAEGRMVYLGVGGAIDGQVNPVMSAAEGQVVQVTIINGEGAEHDIAFPDQNARSPRVTGKGASTTIAFIAGKSGDFLYFCTVPGHRLAGMEGKFVVTPKPPAQTVAYADISRDPTDLPGPLAKRPAQTVRLDLITEEIEGRLAEGTTFGYWTFNGKVPGPFLRVRVGDTLDVHVTNSGESSMIHSVDFHAATGPGGGAAVLQVDPGKEKSMTLKMLVPGLYVYHCATPMVAEHIANGMYGMVLVEPEEGLPKVDHEFYVMQGEIYTDAPFGQHGSQEFSVEKLLAERPEYFVFNGSVGALTALHPMHAKVGETVRVFFGVGGPNFTSSFHVIGTIFDKVYDQGGVLSEPLHGIQTTTVAPGGATVTEFTLKVPGRYAFVDHALARMERGLVGLLIADGPAAPDIYHGEIAPGGGGH
ncbi:MAG TPA: copper-containing nitrite reductase [Stellaceae bacterium]|nr:copper-containing nitrite reductase [Stellaceae bacterium]